MVPGLRSNMFSGQTTCIPDVIENKIAFKLKDVCRRQNVLYTISKDGGLNEVFVVLLENRGGDSSFLN